MTIRTVLVDDHQIFLAGLAELVNKGTDMEVVAMANDGTQALRAIEQHDPDVVLMDITLPGLDGIEITRDAIRLRPEVKVICLSMHADPQLVESMFEAGARAYLAKDCDLAELVTAIRTVAAGESYMSASVVNAVAESLRRGSDPPSPEPAASLTDRERQILVMLADGLTTKQIAGKMQLSVKTIGTHREHLMQKLDIHSIAGLTKYAIMTGLTTVEPPRR